MKRAFLSLVILVVVYGSTQAQIRKVPAVVTATIQAHYPKASSINYEDFLTRYRVHLRTDESKGGDSLIVAISNSGQIKSVTTILELTDIPKPVKEGLDKSKYRSWTVLSVERIAAPATDLQYILGVDGGTVFTKKNLYFSTSGQLLKDRNTL
ncbi:MAG TPA: hypothetical protein VL053_02370 [Arachidicoccus sp.]|nr:hypothetical protein [Arachidicoccus sp.]